MISITVTTHAFGSAEIQDPFPSDGRLAIDVPPATTKTFPCTESQYSRIRPQLDALVTAGILTALAVSESEEDRSDRFLELKKTAPPAPVRLGYGDFYFGVDGKPYAKNDLGVTYNLGVTGGAGIIWKGFIAVAADFPLPAGSPGGVETGWLYGMVADVIDNDPTKTNTGIVFTAGDEALWDGTTWQPVGNEALVSLSNVVTDIMYVDGNRVDAYTENGSFLHPWKDIMSAVNAIAALGDANYHVIDIASGIYQENVVLEHLGLHYIKLQGNGYVSINPPAGNALQSTANNANLKALLTSDIGFAKPVVIIGTPGSDSFNDVIWERPKFTGTATLSVSCVNNFSMVDPYSEKNITYVNVNWSYVESGQLQGLLSLTMDDTLPLPLSGKDGTLLANGVFQSGAVSYVIGGTATYTVAPQGCRWGAAGAVAVPAGVTILLYNTWMRGTVTNAGSITLRNGNVEAYVAGGGTLTFTANAATQVHFDPVLATGLGFWLVADPVDINSAIDRLAAALVAHTGVPIA